MSIRSNLSQIAGDFGAILQTRAEIFSLELAEQRNRFFSLLGLFALGVVFLSLALVVFSIFVVSFFWPGEFRYWAIGGLALVYVLIGLGLMFRLLHRLKTDPTPFEVTRQELSQDLALASAWQTAMLSTSHRAEHDSDPQQEDFHAR
jgi:uncharacterized membrane protein YqjE